MQAGGIFDHMIEIVSVAELINDAYLVQPIVYAPPVVVDLTGLRTKYGDFERDALADRMDSPKVTGDAVDHYRRLCGGTTAVAFGVSIQHCEHIAADFRAAGYNFQVIDGGMEDKRRDSLIDGLGKEIQGLVSCDLIGEGVDIPAIGCAIMLRPTQSMVLHVQQMGRALRPIYADGFDLSTVDGRRGALRAAGKEHAIILDHVGNSLRHGLPETPREWSLDGVKKKKKKAEEDAFRILQCKVCFAAFEPAATCPQCGAPVRSEARQIEVVDGELARITAEDIAAMKEQKRIEVAQAKTIDDLKRIERERNYTPGWAEHIYAAKKKKIEAHRRRREANARTELFG